MVNNERIYKQQTMLNRVKTIVAHQKQITKIKGESFNIYNILNLKTNEVRTHSAFIAELMNPQGSHQMGSVFLEAFLNGMPSENYKNHLDIENTQVFIEYYIGLIDKKTKTGGRIDIFLKDSNGNTISIENKIDAGDQEQQVERYCNYNKANNRVIYLSKDGKEPDNISKGELQNDVDYQLISYNTEIINWLQTCQSVACDQPLLRESIKQYRILIQQITRTLENKEDLQLTEIVKENLEEASLIASKYEQVVRKLKMSFRDRVLEILIQKMTGFNITNQTIDKKHSNIWFHNEDLQRFPKVWFGAESFSGNGFKDGLLFIGIFDKNNSLQNRQEFIPINKQWLHHQPLLYGNQEINLSDNILLNEISNKENLEKAAQIVAEQIEDFIEEHRFLLENKIG